MKASRSLRPALASLAVAALLGLSVPIGHAEEEFHRGGPPGRGGPGPHPIGREAVIRMHPELGRASWGHHLFIGHDVHLFGPAELALWRGGLWYHEWHNGVFGWWFFVDGSWYMYDAPVYPYPLVVSPTVYVEPAVAAVAPPPGPVTVAPPPPAPVAAAPPPGPPQFWYFCDASQTYYPYVQTCASQFRPVPIPSGPPPQ